MGILRNSVKVFGLTPEDEFPKKENGQTIEYSEVDYLPIPGNMMRVNTLKEVDMRLEISQGRVINTPSGKIIIIDGVKKINIKYSPIGGRYDRLVELEFKLPFNTFADIPGEAGEVEAIDAYLLDAYFQVIGSRKIYYHTLYMINVKYPILK